MRLRGPTRKFYHLFSNYCGLGGYGIPSHTVDQLCMEHDNDYQQMLENGVPWYKVYTQFNDADQKLLDKLEKISPDNVAEQISQLGGRFFFQLKRQVSNYVGLLHETGNDDETKEDFITPDRVGRQSVAIITPAKKRSFPNLPSDSQMSKRTRTDTEGDVDMEASTALALRSSAGGTSKGTQETSITYSKPSYLLQDTHTCILPVTFWGSMVLAANEATDLILRMNSYRSPLVTTLSSPAANPSTSWGAKFTKGLFNNKIAVNYDGSFTSNPVTDTEPTTGPAGLPRRYYFKGERPNGTRWTQNKYVFPDTLTAGAQPICTSAAWWEKMYSFYTVLGCEYDITFEHTQHIDNSDVVVGYGIDVYSATKTDAKYPLSSDFSDVQYWKNIRWHVIETPSKVNPETRYSKITGQYSPGNAKRLVTNDEEVKTWTSTGASTPELMEDLHLMVFPSPFNTIHDTWAVGTSDNVMASEAQNMKTTLNFQVTLKYTVQYKDLKTGFRYPNLGDAGTIALNYPADLTRANVTEQ